MTKRMPSFPPNIINDPSRSKDFASLPSDSKYKIFVAERLNMTSFQIKDAYISLRERKEDGSLSAQSQMAVQREIFEDTGPKQLTDVDWTNDHHLRAVAASLVQGVYNLEFDRQHFHDGTSVRWWHFFYFELKDKLIDEKDSSIYGAVYELKHPYPNHLPERAPKYVIAFRGTIPKPRSTLRRDLQLDFKVLTDELHRDESRFKHALEAVDKVVQQAGSANIWLVGHSLGSAIAMLVGKSMAQEEKYLKTFLFNPPFLRLSLSRKNAIRSTKKIIKAGISLLGGDHLWQELHHQFNALSPWIPTLFVNKNDPICSGYIDHFRNRKIEAEIRSIWSALKAAVRKDPQLPIHLLPKAYLTISENSSSGKFCKIRKILEAHGLKQWWYQMSIGPGFADSSTNVSIGDPILMGEP